MVGHRASAVSASRSAAYTSPSLRGEGMDLSQSPVYYRILATCMCMYMYIRGSYRGGGGRPGISPPKNLHNQITLECSVHVLITLYFRISISASRMPQNQPGAVVQ